MRDRSTDGRRTTTAALLDRLAASIDAEHPKLAEAELEAVVSFLSKALTLAESRMRHVRRTRARTSEPTDPAYWLG